MIFKDLLFQSIQRFCDLVFANIPRRQSEGVDWQNLRLVAHRGAPEDQCKENTVEAFRNCLSSGVWGIEFDLRWTKDNIPVVSHDDRLKRVFRLNQKISELNFEELKNLCPMVPSLKTVVDEFGGKLHFMIELKQPLDSEQRWKKLIESLASLRPIQDFHFLSLNPVFFENWSHFPEESRILVTELQAKNISEKTLKMNCGGCAGHYLLMGSRQLQSLHAGGRKMGTGFISSVNLLNREMNREVDWIFSDHAAQLQRHVNKRLLVPKKPSDFKRHNS